MVIEEMSEIRLIPFDNNYRNDFFLLNKEWIEEYWELEKSDKKDLLNPEKISQRGGEIFLVLKKNTVIGTCAMIKISSKSYELAKMTISQKYRGRGYSNLLMNASINFARNQKAEKIILGKGRLLVRKSGTEPKIRIMCESHDKSLLSKCINIVSNSIKKN